MKREPLSWKEFKKLHKGKKIHTREEQIKKYGILLMPEDVNDFENEQRKEIRKNLKNLFDEFLEGNFEKV